MSETASAPDWASARRRSWSASRISAALALHALVLLSLKLAIDRVELPRHGADRATTLVSVTLHPTPPRPLPIPRTPPVVHAPANAPGAHTTPAPTRPREDAAQAITLPAPPQAEPAVAAATPPASSPQADLSFLDSAATRQAIRAVARGDTLASHGNALTHEEPGSEMVAADGSHQGMQRNLPPPPPALALAQGIDAAHKGDCMKGDYLGAGMGLLSVPFLLANEALGKCAHKL
jgi:hypothetical protein